MKPCQSKVSTISPTASPSPIGQARPKTGMIVLSDGTTVSGYGFGATGVAVGEICFNTAMTGYQEILTDPSYARQIITFTFPHIGNVGTNIEDLEFSTGRAENVALGAIVRTPVSPPSNYRATNSLDSFMKQRGLIGISGIDTRALTALIRDKGMQHGVIAHNETAEFDQEALLTRAQTWHGMEGQDLASTVSTLGAEKMGERRWQWNTGFAPVKPSKDAPHICIIDFGVKKNILRCLSDIGFTLTVVPADCSFEALMALKPNGVVLSNGPGDPAATARKCLATIKSIITAKIPTLGICLGHQILAHAIGANTQKMAQGHHGANHPVKDLTTGKVEIVSMNHGFTVDPETLPADAIQTHKSLFDGTNAGFALKNAPVFSIQHHPEASPGPQDSYYLFERYAEMVRAHMTKHAPS